MNTDNVILSTIYKSERAEFFLAAWLLRIRNVTNLSPKVSGVLQRSFTEILKKDTTKLREIKLFNSISKRKKAFLLSTTYDACLFADVSYPSVKSFFNPEYISVSV